MNVVISIVVVLIFLSILIVLLSTLFRGESFSLRYSDLLEELAEKHQGKLRLVSFGPYSAVELPLFFGSMLVGVWNRSMSGTHTIPRATISIQSTSFKDIPEFRINSKEGISCGYIHGFKKASCKDSSTDPKSNRKLRVSKPPEISGFGLVYRFNKSSHTNSALDSNFDQKWCIFVRPETSSQQINALFRQLNPALTHLSHQALMTKWTNGLVNISCGDQKIDFVYSRPIYDIDTLEILMQASVKLAQALL
jgi:hypothetical protein